MTDKKYTTIVEVRDAIQTATQDLENALNLDDTVVAGYYHERLKVLIDNWTELVEEDEHGEEETDAEGEPERQPEQQEVDQREGET